jgi:hypothetical protein
MRSLFLLYFFSLHYDELLLWVMNGFFLPFYFISFTSVFHYNLNIFEDRKFSQLRLITTFFFACFTVFNLIIFTPLLNKE